MPVVVEGVLVEKPNATLHVWIRAIVIVHTLGLLFTAYTYELHHVQQMEWFYLFFSWLVLGIIIPCCGMKASMKTDKKCLAVFSGVQGFVGFCNLINLFVFTSLMVSVISWCVSETCQKEFLTRNGTCAVDMGNSTYDMDEKYCDNIPNNMGTAIFFGLLSFVSCMGAVQARKVNEVKIVHVITMEAQNIVPTVPEYVQPI